MKTPTLYCDDGTEVELPFRWEICTACEGHCTDRGASVECDGGGFTSSEWAEQDEDFQQAYLKGEYDKPCTYCAGTGKVRRADRKRMSKAQWRAWCKQQRDDREIDAIHAMERRMGA